MSLIEQMRMVEGRHTRGAEKPLYFLLHPADYQEAKDIIQAERERLKAPPNLGYELLTFNGIPIVEFMQAEGGKPLVVMG